MIFRVMKRLIVNTRFVLKLKISFFFWRRRRRVKRINGEKTLSRRSSSIFQKKCSLCLLHINSKKLLQGVGCSRKNVAQVCEEELCSMTAKKILSSVSWKVDPCQHFSRFACGSRVKKNKFFKETRERSASDFETFKQNLDRLFQRKFDS